jgi:CelD/BcsL family acetyltransferase involved in cellulose biosynthesis
MTRGETMADIRIEVVDQWPAFLALAAEWNALLARSPQRDNPMLTHEWFRAWWEAFGEGRDLLVLRLRAGDRTVGFAPMMRSREKYYGLPCRALTFITNDHANRADFILAERDEACREAILDWALRRAPRWGLAELNFVPADSPTVAFLRSRAGRLGLSVVEKPSYASPWIDMAGGWDKLYAGRDGHFRRNLRNREKRLAALGPLEYEERPPVLNGVLDEMFEVGERSWKGEEQTAIGSTPALRRFYARLAELSQPLGALSLHLLRVGGKPIAFHYSLRNTRGLYLLKTEYDTAYHTYSPGHQIQKRVLEAACGQGVEEFDFLGPDMEWKRDWTATVRPHLRLLLYHRGPRSRMLKFLEVRMKPMLKRLAATRTSRGTEASS